jgi:hypothetical protein
MLISRGGQVMPAHDWTRVDAGLFLAFYQRWIGSLCDVLNTGGLLPDYLALAEQSIRGPIPDVLTLQLSPHKGGPSGIAPIVNGATAPPRARVVHVLPDMPLFLESELSVPVPLEDTYQATWQVFPAALKGLLEPTRAADDPSVERS